jgi:hypothetical protein
MYKSARIIKKGSEPIGVELSKLEKPNPDKFKYTDGDFDAPSFYEAEEEWLSSFEWHAVKSEVEWNFWFRHYHPKYKDCALLEYEWDLKEGIDISPDLVKLKKFKEKKLIKLNHDYLDDYWEETETIYATLIQPESKEDSEDEIKASELSKLMIDYWKAYPILGSSDELAELILKQFLIKRK